MGKFFYELAHDQWDIPELRELLEKILPEKITMDDFSVKHEVEGLGKREMILNARRSQNGTDSTRILLAIEDITERIRP